MAGIIDGFRWSILPAGRRWIRWLLMSSIVMTLVAARDWHLATSAESNAGSPTRSDPTHDRCQCSAERLGKRYRLRHRHDEPVPTSRCAMSIAPDSDGAVPGRRALGLDDASKSSGRCATFRFDIDGGEVVGIIGRNGAGKSTLLKILSRITEPTNGRVELHGRVASLLEVGTGFHPGADRPREHLSQRRDSRHDAAEIIRKFDEIVAFAGSRALSRHAGQALFSGMYVRLAFAVAAHLEPEILIVDEVLAVGDAEFQQQVPRQDGGGQPVGTHRTFREP